MQKCIGIIGVGNMGEALLAGLSHGGEICFAEKRDERAAEISSKYGAVRKEIGAIGSDCDLIFLVVKPQDLESTLNQLAPGLKEKALLVSLVAGKTTAFIASKVKPTNAVIRVMPNTPTLIGKGMAALSAGPNASSDDLDYVASILSKSGEVVVVDESLQDAVTATSGSGPAYFFAFVEAMIAGATDMGIDEAIATQLTIQTIVGAAKMLDESGKSAKTLRENVTSPKGMTYEGLKVFAEADLNSLVAKAMKAAADRSREMA